MSDFALRLAQAVAASPLSLQQLARLLKEDGTPVSNATLSYWCTGRSLPTRARSREAVARLEELLELLPGTLLGSLPDPEGGSPWSLVTPSGYTPALRACLDRMGLAVERNLENLVVGDWLQVSPDHGDLCLERTMMVRAQQKRVSRTAMVLPMASPSATVTAVEGLRGCHVAAWEVVEHVLVLDLALSCALLPGDLGQHTVTIRWSDPTHGLWRHVASIARPTRHHAVVVDFGDERPHSVRLTRTDREYPVVRELGPAAQVSDCRDQAAPGTVLIEWRPAEVSA